MRGPIAYWNAKGSGPGLPYSIIVYHIRVGCRDKPLKIELNPIQCNDFRFRNGGVRSRAFTHFREVQRAEPGFENLRMDTLRLHEEI